MNTRDRKLGMGRDISRRDFINDVALGAAALSVPAASLAETISGDPESGGRYYPPTRTGLRGSHPGAWEAAHALARDGEKVTAARDIGERYDLVVVGAGISGLAAAYFYRQHYGPEARILLLENHDDFGGHAKRNEFHQGGELRLAWGGTINITYQLYSRKARALLDSLGIDLVRLTDAREYSWTEGTHGLINSTWFGADQYGRDVLLKGAQLDLQDPVAMAAHVDDFPISAEAKTGLRQFLLEDSDLLHGKTWDEKVEWVHGTSYADFLRHAGVPDEAVALFEDAPLPMWGLRASRLSVAECMFIVLPGMHRLGDFRAYFEDDTFESEKTAMFPDGNASLARLLVRSLIPASTPDFPADADPHDIVGARLDYESLDQATSAVRLRLNSTVLNVQERPEGSVLVSYANGGQVFAVQARQVVMACYNRIIPHLVPGLPEPQKAALAKCVKRPMLVVNVLLRDGQAIQKSGLLASYTPGRLLQNFRMVWGANAGQYRQSFNAKDSVVIQFYCGFCGTESPDMTIAQQHQAARAQMLALEFSDYEREVRTILTGVYGESGFDAARDILAITVNRWPHGYARDHTDLEDDDWNIDPPPNVVGRQRFGNIAIANSDAGADAYTHIAIDQAWRAIKELST